MLLLRCMSPELADIVAKVPKYLAAIFSKEMKLTYARRLNFSKEMKLTYARRLTWRPGRWRSRL